MKNSWWRLKVSIWWLLWAVMLCGFIYYQYIQVINSKLAEQKKYAFLLKSAKNNSLENGSGVSQLSHMAKTIKSIKPFKPLDEKQIKKEIANSKPSDAFRTPEPPNNSK